jgi:predicted membrane-bound spermidine synthase
MLAPVLVLVFLSGATALIYEVVWTRVLVLTLGSTAQAVSSILGAFLGGLAFGAALFGRRADRTRRPLLLYAALEAAIGLYAIVFPWLEGAFHRFMLQVEPAGAATFGFSLARFAGVFLLLLPATAAMGGTIPVLCRFAVRADERLGRRVAVLYAVNTLGGAVGCFAAGFLTIRTFGIAASLEIAAVTNLAIALTASTLGRRIAMDMLPAANQVPPRAPRRRAQIVVAVAFAISGLTALGYEILWTRVLVFWVKSVTYGFSFMLGTFLFGLVIGSGLVAPFVDRKGWARPLFATLELAAGGGAFASVYLLVMHADSLRAFVPRGEGSPTALYLSLAFLVVFTILPAGILFGATFPLATRLLADRAAGAPGRVGFATAANTGGAILGAFVTGFVLLPTLGVVAALKALVTLNAAAAVALAWPLRGRARSVISAAALLVLVIVLPGRDFFVARLAEIRPGKMIFADEGEDVIVTVYEERDRDETIRTIYVNGSSYTGSRFFARRYMKTMGHLPLLLCERKKNALVICLGTGMTLSALARHEDLERIACAELSQGVKRALPLFAEVNDRVFENPRVEIAIEDGRHYVLTGDATWDVITLEPPPPLNAGVGDLYSKEFYEICKQKLSPGGVLCQWFPMHSQTVAEYRMGLATFVEVFPDASLWLPVGRNSIAIGVKEGAPPWDFARLASRFESPRVREGLAEIGFPSPESLLAACVLDARALREFLGHVPLVTDDRPRLEFHDLSKAAERFPAGTLLRELMLHRIDAKRWLEARGLGSRIDNERYAAAASALESFYRGAFFFESGRAEEATAAWREAVESEPENLYYRSILGEGAAER